jgi:hypothetical protein
MSRRVGAILAEGVIMGWVMQKVADFGSSNEYISRLVLQTKEIASFTTLSKEEREALLLACFALSHRMANAQAAAEDMEHRFQVAFNELKERHKDHTEVVEIPYIPNLEIIFEGFFYNAKNIVRDLGVLMGLIYGKRFSEASDWCAFGNKKESNVSSYFQRLTRKHAGYATIRNMVENSRDVIELIVRIRNAVEHPGGSSGTLNLINCQISPEGIHGPKFSFDGETKDYAVIASLKEVHELLLDLAETVIVFGLMFRFAFSNLGIKHIQREDRTADEPKAWRVITVTSEMTEKSEPFDGNPKVK